jgi:hypothetical protein
MKNFSITVFLSFIIFTAHAQVKVIGTSSSSKTAQVSGTVLDSNGETTAGATVFITSLKRGTSVEADGSFSLSVPVGIYEISVSLMGFKTQTIKVNVLGSGTINIVLDDDQMQLNEVVISNTRPEENVKSTDMGKSVLSIEALESMPSFVGEIDIIKSLTLLPGVSTIGEASSGFNVRGGSTSQNLILLGGATLYNPSHLFGFFTAFNSDLVQNVTLYKGGIPAKYGGRASSILDVKYRGAASKEWEGKATLGLISAKVAVEGPVIKDKLFVLLGGRSSYSDWMLGAIRDPDINNSSASFYDVNAIVNYRINNRNNFYYSFYTSNDKFGLSTDVDIAWKNMNHVLDWHYNAGDRFTYTLSLINDQYRYTIADNNAFSEFDLNSGIHSNTIRFNTDIKLFRENFINTGFETSLKTINPGELKPNGGSSLVNSTTIEKENALESAFFLESTMVLHKNLSITAGARYNMYTYLGNKRVYSYEEYVPKTEESITDSAFYKKNDAIINFAGIEPRFSLRWSLNSSSSIKIGFNRMYQYLHLISNTSTIAPTDLWKLSDNFVAPQIVDQYSLGFFKNFRNNSYESSIEVYYKDIDNIVEYKDGAELMLNPHIETELLTGIGRAYGIELHIKKKLGKMTGWLGYTYSRSLVRVEGAYKETTINRGEWYSSNFDKPHDFTAVMMYKINAKWSISSNFTLSTGRPVTYPSGKFNYEGQLYAYFNDRNSFRVPSYHRLDFSATFKSTSKIKILNGDWSFSIYNVYGRKNAFSVFFDDVDGAPPQAYKLSVLGIPFPSVSYSFKF